MTTTTAKLAAGKLDEARGITDDVARKMYDSQDGKTYMAVVELGYADRTDRKGDKHQVRLEVLHLELAGDEEQTRHLRDLSRSIYHERTPAQVDIDTLDDVEPHADEIIRRGQALISCPHCLHGKTSEEITHAPEDADGEWCEWKDCEHPVTVGTEQCEHPDHETETEADAALVDEVTVHA